MADHCIKTRDAIDSVARPATEVRQRYARLIACVAPRPDWQWLIFAYVVLDFDGVVAGNHREGRLHWWPLDHRHRIAMPEADQLFFDPVVLGTGEPYERTFHYDTELQLRLA